MADNTAKIIIDASADGVLRAADQVKKKFAELGKEGSSAGGKMFDQLTKSILKAATLAAVVEGVASAYNKAATNAAKLAESAGKKQLGAELAGIKLGLSAQQTQGLMNAQGPRSAEEKTAFLNNLRGLSGPGGQTIDAQTASRAATLFNTGVIDFEDVSKSFSKRGRRGLDTLFGEAGRRRGELSDGSTTELGVQTEEQAAAKRIDATASDFGTRNRLADARRSANAAENTGSTAITDAIHDTFNKVPILGHAINEGIDAVNRRSLEQQQVKLLEGIKENSRPRLNHVANGP